MRTDFSPDDAATLQAWGILPIVVEPERCAAPCDQTQDDDPIGYTIEDFANCIPSPRFLRARVDPELLAVSFALTSLVVGFWAVVGGLWVNR